MMMMIYNIWPIQKKDRTLFTVYISCHAIIIFTIIFIIMLILICFAIRTRDGKKYGDFFSVLSAHIVCCSAPIDLISKNTNIHIYINKGKK